uniref:Transposase (Putative), gypsy type n=1 Tax=Tanacetum cinerariifolium TaxID=118510 RepID=A0A699I2A9_TANCI|nr:hypothetical protein [Tanacetum cinerariifolium]
MPATGAALEVSLEEKVADMGPRLSKKRRKRVNDGADANAPPKVLRKDYASVRPEQSTYGGKTLPIMGLAVDSTFVTPADMNGVSDPDPLSYAEPQQHPKQSMTQHALYGKCKVRRSTSPPSMAGSPEGIYQPGWGVTNRCRLDTPDACQDVVDHIVPSGYFSKLRHMSNANFLIQYIKNLVQQVAMGSQPSLRFEQEVRLLKKARAQVARQDQRIQVREEEIKRLYQEIQSLRLVESEVHRLKSQAKKLKHPSGSRVTDKERLKAAFEEFKKYEDDRVEKRCAEMDARLDALSIDFDEELYPHMLTAIASRRWVIGHGLRLAVMKCAESIELRHAFANVVY